MREIGNEKLLTLLEKVTKATRNKTIDTDFVGQSDVSNHYCINQGMKRNTCEVQYNKTGSLFFNFHKM